MPGSKFTLQNTIAADKMLYMVYKVKNSVQNNLHSMISNYFKKAHVYTHSHITYLHYFLFGGVCETNKKKPESIEKLAAVFTGFILGLR